MRYSTALAGAFALRASAFPFVLENVLESRQSTTFPGTGTDAEKAASKARTNCGPVPCTSFNAAEQLVSITGENAYASPAASQIRGPCPGLNAAANHGYLDRSGVVTIQDTITGLGDAYGMTVDLSAFLAAVAIILDGDPVQGTWSIGGPPPADALTKGLLGQAQGISYSHNNYENDASIARFDAYVNHGDAHSLSVPRFAAAYAAHNGSGYYNLDLFAQNYQQKAQESIATNPYAFFGPFSGLVAPAAYNFVINFMSNHTAEQPSGYLDGEMFKTFFGITGTYPNFQWLKGQERIPDNWYRRPQAEGYSVAGVLADLGVQFLAYPDSFYLGGNTGEVNSFQGVELGNLTGGVYNSENLLKGNNLGCFFTQAVQAGLPDAASIGAATLSSIDNLINKYITPVTGSLNCPEVGKYDQTLFNKFPGYKYQPNGPATNYKQ